MSFNWMNDTDKTRWLEVDQKGAEVTKLSKATCPSCSDEIIAIKKSWIGKCKTCGVLYNFFQGTPIQTIVCSAISSVIINIGAVGSGKTTMNAYIISNHMRLLPSSVVLSFALTLQQLKRFAIPELEKFFHPDEFLSKGASLWVLNNGSSIEFIASDDQEKVRSANATAIWLIEAASPKMKPIYKQGLTRLRNENGIKYAYNKDGSLKRTYYENGTSSPVVLENHTIMLVEANVKKNSWLKKELLKSHTVFYTKSVRGVDILKTLAKPEKVLSEFSNKEENHKLISILNASIDNPILTEDWFKSIRASMDTEEEYLREIYCDMTSEDGLVFKDFITNFDSIFIPMHSTYSPDPNVVWVESLDPGGSKEGNDETGYVLGQLNKRNNTLRFVDELRVTGKTLAEECELITQIRNKHGWTKNKSFIFTGDNVLTRALKTNRNQSLKNDYELRLGTFIDVCDAKGIKQGVGKMMEWFKAEAITFSDTMYATKQELLSYEYITKLEVVKGVPVDVQRFSAGEEHIIDAIRYLIVKLESRGFRQTQHIIDGVRDQNSKVNGLITESFYSPNTQKDLVNRVLSENLPQFNKNFNSGSSKFYFRPGKKF